MPLRSNSDGGPFITVQLAAQRIPASTDQHVHDILAFEALSRFNRQALSREDIDDG
jgi:hypothetical protein